MSVVNWEETGKYIAPTFSNKSFIYDKFQIIIIIFFLILILVNCHEELKSNHLLVCGYCTNVYFSTEKKLEDHKIRVHGKWVQK